MNFSSFRSTVLTGVIGYRTYIATGLGILACLAAGFSLITWAVALTIIGLLGFGSLAALRSAVTSEVAAAVAYLESKYSVTLPPAGLSVSPMPPTPSSPVTPPAGDVQAS